MKNKMKALTITISVCVVIIGGIFAASLYQEGVAAVFTVLTSIVVIAGIYLIVLGILDTEDFEDL